MTSNNCPATVAAMPGVCLRAISEHAPRMVSGFALTALLALSQGCTGLAPRAAAEVPRPIARTAGRTASLTAGAPLGGASTAADSRPLASGVAAANGRVRDLLQQAEQEYRAGKLEAADNLLEEVRRLQPGAEQAYRLCARIALDRGDRGAHRLAGDRYLAAHRESAAAWHLVGQHALEAGDERIAVRLLERAAELNPAEPRYALDFASACIAAESPERAEAVLLRAQERSPRDTSLPIALARYYESCGRWDEAVHHYRRALSTAPNNLQWHRQLARCLYRQGNFEASRREFQVCVQSELQLSLAESLEFGDACLQAGEFAHAQRIFDEIARASSHRVKEIELLRSTCAIRQGNWQRARGILTSAQAQWPDDGAIDELLALCVPGDSPAAAGGSTIQLAGHDVAVESSEPAASGAGGERASEWRPTTRKSAEPSQAAMDRQPVIVAAATRTIHPTSQKRPTLATEQAAIQVTPRVTPRVREQVKERKSAGWTPPERLPVVASAETGAAGDDAAVAVGVARPLDVASANALNARPLPVAETLSKPVPLRAPLPARAP